MRVIRDSLADKVKDLLLDRIVKGKYKPGERLMELPLAKEFGVSQTPVREALQILEAMRLVESQPNRGTHVREITDRELSEVRIVRGALEEAAARTAAIHLKDRAEELHAMHAAILRSLESRDLDELAKQCVEFHRTIVQNCGNAMLLQTWESLAIEAKSRISARKIAYSVLEKGIGYYAAIVEALTRGDGPAAGRLLREQAEEVSRNQATISARISADDLQGELKKAKLQSSN